MTTAPEPTEFGEFMTRLRCGDQTAAEELVTKYEPIVRREIRMHLEDRRMARLFDSVDFSQSVFASFVFRAMAGEYQLDDPHQLAALLLKIARNKLASKARWQFRDKREAHRDERGGHMLDVARDKVETPSQVVSAQELILKCRQALSEAEQQIVELRGQHLSWQEISEMLGQSPDALRMQLKRATDRVSRQFDLVEF